MKILIFGFAKTGSSILAHRIAGAGDFQLIFEPRGPRNLAAERQQNVVAKALVGATRWEDLDSYRDYEKRIWLARDPRDVAVSRCLYQFWKGHRHSADANQLAELLNQKIARPTSIPFHRVYQPATDIFESLIDDDRERYSMACRHVGNFNADWFVFRYESMIDGDYAALERYLGFELARLAEVPERLARVRRTRAYGDWRNWFTAADVPIFRPIYQPYMDLIGYEDDWRSAAQPCIDPRTSTDYLESIRG